MITLKLSGYNSKSAIALRNAFSECVNSFMESNECKVARGVCENCELLYPCSNLTSSISYLNTQIADLRRKEGKG